MIVSVAVALAHFTLPGADIEIANINHRTLPFIGPPC
jgi:hypothetical protein